MESETPSAPPGHGRFVGLTGLVLLAVPAIAFAYASVATVS